MNKPLLYIHIGAQKTGTSYIQEELLYHREKLINNGILYPLAGLHGSGHAALATNFINPNHRKSLNSSNIFTVKSSVNRIRDDILFEINQSAQAIRSVIISSEAFSLANIENIRNLSSLFEDYFTIKIVYFLRKQDVLAESIRSQAYRVNQENFNPTRLIQSFEEELNFNYILKKWEAVFELNNINIFEYRGINSLSNNASKAFELPKIINFRKRIVNKTLGRDLLEYIHFYTDIVYADGNYFECLDALADVERNNPSSIKYKYFYSPETHENIRKRYQAENTEIELRYGINNLFTTKTDASMSSLWMPYKGLSETKRHFFNDVLKKFYPNSRARQTPKNRNYNI